MRKFNFLMILVITVFFAVNINAATFNVNTTADTQDATPGNGVCADSGGNCSLRAAITEANALAGADTINLPPGTYTQTLVSAGDNNNAGGDWDLNTEISIIGTDPLTTIVQANAMPGVATERVFHVRFITAEMTVSISGVTVRNGRNAGNVFGAGIRLDAGAGTLNLNNVIVRDNRNASSGGGISLSAAAGSTLNITNSTITENIAGSTTAGTSGTGGGIQINNNPAFLNIFNSTISNNTATSGITFGLGGGIGCNGTVNIRNSTISGNTAISSVNNAFGGGLYIPSGTTTLLNTIVSNNNATSTASAAFSENGKESTKTLINDLGSAFTGRGAGVYNQNSIFILNSSQITGNTASHAHAAIFTLASTANASTKVRRSNIRNNSAPGEGCGLVNISGSSFQASTEIEHSSISGNNCSGPTSVGGGVLNFSSGSGAAITSCLNSTLSGNSVGGSGGNMLNQQNSGTATININFCTIANATAPVGAGITNVSGQVNLRNSIIAGAANIISGTITSQNYNHVQIVAGGTFVPLANDVVSSNPMLGEIEPLDFGTFGHIPLPNSPVLDRIPSDVNTCFTPVGEDQIFTARPDVTGIAQKDEKCDKGAIEVGITKANRNYDFNDDGVSDFATTRDVGSGPSGTDNQIRWFIGESGTATTSSIDWGVATTDIPVPADYDGDRRADVCTWRSNSGGEFAGLANFFILQSESLTIRVEDFGQQGDDPLIVGDYDGDGIADPAVYREATGGGQSFFFYRGSRNNPAGNITYIPWGTTGDKPLPGDFDGDGRQDFTIRRISGGSVQNWTLFSNGQTRVITFGLPTDKAVTGDFDGDRRNDLAIIRNVGGSMQWWYLPSNSGVAVAINFGLATDFPTPGDYDGDGRTDLSTFRPSATAGATAFWVRNSSNGNVFTLPFGQMGDYPVASRGVTPLVP